MSNKETYLYNSKEAADLIYDFVTRNKGIVKQKTRQYQLFEIIFFIAMFGVSFYLASILGGDNFFILPVVAIPIFALASSMKRKQLSSTLSKTMDLYLKIYGNLADGREFFVSSQTSREYHYPECEKMAPALRNPEYWNRYPQIFKCKKKR